VYQRLLLQGEADRIVAQAMDSAVLTAIGEGTVEDQQIAKLRCGH
jgi:hypothetical protein